MFSYIIFYIKNTSKKIILFMIFKKKSSSFFPWKSIINSMWLSEQALVSICRLLSNNIFIILCMTVWTLIGDLITGSDVIELSVDQSSWISCYTIKNPVFLLNRTSCTRKYLTGSLLGSPKQCFLVRRIRWKTSLISFSKICVM